jgi:hypothetical protein
LSQPPPPSYPEPAPPAQPYSPGGLPFDGTGTPPAPSTSRKVARIALPVLAAGVAGASWFGLGAAGAPEVGDCIQTSGVSDYEVVDCADDAAQFAVVGVEEEEYSEAEFDADDTLCSGFATTEVVLWFGETGSDGTVLCAEPTA